MIRNRAMLKALGLFVSLVAGLSACSDPTPGPDGANMDSSADAMVNAYDMDETTSADMDAGPPPPPPPPDMSAVPPPPDEDGKCSAPKCPPPPPPPTKK